MPTLILASLVATSLIAAAQGTDHPTPVRVLLVTGVDHPAHHWKETAPALKILLEQDGRCTVRIAERSRDPRDQAGVRPRSGPAPLPQREATDSRAAGPRQSHAVAGGGQGPGAHSLRLRGVRRLARIWRPGRDGLGRQEHPRSPRAVRCPHRRHSASDHHRDERLQDRRRTLHRPLPAQGRGRSGDRPFEAHRPRSPHGLRVFPGQGPGLSHRAGSRRQGPPDARSGRPDPPRLPVGRRTCPSSRVAKPTVPLVRAAHPFPADRELRNTNASCYTFSPEQRQAL